MEQQQARNYTVWSEQDDARLRELIAEHLSYAAIGTLMGRNKNQCIGRAHRLGIHNSKTKPVPKKKVAEAVAKAVEVLFPPKPVKAQDNRPAPRYEQPEASTTAFGTPRILMGLRSKHCRFPIGERDGQHLFCCADRDGMRPYCSEHCLVAYRQTERQRASSVTKAYR